MPFYSICTLFKGTYFLQCLKWTYSAVTLDKIQNSHSLFRFFSQKSFHTIPVVAKFQIVLHSVKTTQIRESIGLWPLGAQFMLNFHPPPPFRVCRIEPFCIKQLVSSFGCDGERCASTTRRL